MTRKTVFTLDKRGKSHSYLIWQRDPQQARPWAARNLKTGQHLGSFKTLENAERNLREYLTGWSEEVVVCEA